MIKQNQTRRTIISFSIAFATALFTLFIQDIREDQLLQDQTLEANVFADEDLHLQK